MNEIATARSSRSGSRRAKAGLAALFVVALSGACGGTGAADGPVIDPNSAAAKAFAADVRSAVAAQNAPLTNRPPTSGPTAAVDVTVVEIPVAAAAEGGIRILDAAEEAMDAIGWEYIRIDPQGDPTRMAAAVRKAIVLGADAIVTAAIDDNVIAAPLAEAREAGIVVAAAYGGNANGGYDTALPDDAQIEQSGYLLGQVAYELSDRRLHAIELMDEEFNTILKRQQGWRDFIEDCQESGGDCKTLETANFLVNEVTTKLPGLAATVARQNPDFTVLWTGYDSAMAPAVSGLRSAGLAESASLGVSLDGNAENIEMIRDDGYQKATIALPATWTGYAIIDQVNRLLAGEEALPVADQGVAFKVMTGDTVPDEGLWDGDVDVRDAYLKLWQGP